jgi:hypothetical protein
MTIAETGSRKPDFLDRVINLRNHVVMEFALRSSILPIWNRAIDTFIEHPDGPATYVATANVSHSESLELHESLIIGAIDAYARAVKMRNSDPNQEKTLKRVSLALAWSMAWMNREDSTFIRDEYKYNWEHDRLMMEMRYSALAIAIATRLSGDNQTYIWQRIRSVGEDNFNDSMTHESDELLSEILICNSVLPDENDDLGSLQYWLLFLSGTDEQQIREISPEIISNSFARIVNARDKRSPNFTRIIERFSDHYRYLGAPGLDSMIRMFDVPDVWSIEGFTSCLQESIRYNSDSAIKLFEKRLVSHYSNELAQAAFMLPFLKNSFSERELLRRLNIFAAEEFPQVRTAALISAGRIEGDRKNEDSNIQLDTEKIILNALAEEKDPEVRLSIYKYVTSLVSENLLFTIMVLGKQERDIRIQPIVQNLINARGTTLFVR